VAARGPGAAGSWGGAHSAWSGAWGLLPAAGQGGLRPWCSRGPPVLVVIGGGVIRYPEDGSSWLNLLDEPPCALPDQLGLLGLVVGGGGFVDVQRQHRQGVGQRGHSRGSPECEGPELGVGDVDRADCDIGGESDYQRDYPDELESFVVDVLAGDDSHSDRADQNGDLDEHVHHSECRIFGSGGVADQRYGGYAERYSGRYERYAGEGRGATGGATRSAVGATGGATRSADSATETATGATETATGADPERYGGATRSATGRVRSGRRSGGGATGGLGGGHGLEPP